MLRRMEYGFGMNRKLIPCNLCGSSQWEPFVIGTDRLHGFEGQFMYVRYSQCGLVFMNPPISPEEISRYYPDDYAPHQKTASSEDETRRVVVYENAQYTKFECVFFQRKVVSAGLSTAFIPVFALNDSPLLSKNRFAHSIHHMGQEFQNAAMFFTVSFLWKQYRSGNQRSNPKIQISTGDSFALGSSMRLGGSW